MLEKQFIFHAKAKKPSADDGLGLQTWSFALVPVTLIGSSGLCLEKGNMKAQSLLQSRKETAGLDITSWACHIKPNESMSLENSTMCPLLEQRRFVMCKDTPPQKT